MNSAIQPNDYVHHGQGGKLLRHGREQDIQLPDEQPEKRQNDPVILLCVIQSDSTGLAACQSAFRIICHFRAVMYAPFGTWTIYKHERL